jgi:hypothetical protein
MRYLTAAEMTTVHPCEPSIKELLSIREGLLNQPEDVDVNAKLRAIECQLERRAIPICA